MISVFEHLTRLLKYSFIYGLSNVGNAFAGLLLLPIYTRVFPPAEYGVIEIILTAQALVSAIVSLQIASGAARYYYETGGRQRQVLISTGLFLLLPLASLASLGTFIWREQISQLLFSSPIYGTPISIAFFNVLLWTISSYQLLILRFKQKAVKYSVLAVGNTVSTALLSIYFVVYLHMGVTGVFLGTFVTSVVINIILFLLNRKFLTFAFSRAQTKNILTYSLPLTPLRIAGWFKTYIYRFLLLPLIGLSGVGIFSGAIRVSSIILMLLTSFRLGWTPFAMSVLHEDNHKIIYSKVLTYFTATLTAVAMIIILFSYEITHILMASSYWDAAIFVGPLAAALVLDGMYYISSIGTSIVKKTYFNTIAYLIGVAVGIITIVGLVPHIGIMGAAIAALLSSAAILVSALYFAQRNYHIDYEIKRLLGIMLLLLVTIPLAIFTNGISSAPLRVGVKIAEMGVLFLGLWECLPQGEVLSGLNLLRQRVLQNSPLRLFFNLGGKANE